MIRSIFALIAAMFVSQSCFGWSEGGHNLIAVMAFDELTSDQQASVLEILKAHPRFAEDFATPAKASNVEHYLIGRSAYWPDVARSQPTYNRPSWHYQLGSALTIGEIKPPVNPGPVPADATLATKDLYIAQAIELCRKILCDKSQPMSDRAIALCWIGHLVGDSHQPCHSGSLYCPMFLEGDRGANSIPTKQSKNMHALWDGLLGPRFDEGDIKRRSLEIKADIATWEAAKQAVKADRGMDPLTWLAESAQCARTTVYTPEVLKPIEMGGKTDKLEPLDLSESYLKTAGKLAQQRAAFSAIRLAAILREAALTKAE